MTGWRQRPPSWPHVGWPIEPVWQIAHLGPKETGRGRTVEPRPGVSDLHSADRPNQPRAPLVSLIIPTYHRARQLQVTLAAIARQTWPAEAREVIVVDDGSGDDTRAVVESSPLTGCRYIAQPNRGATLARNLGAEHARGEALVFLDDDIELAPTAVNALMTIHRAERRAIVVGKFLKPGDDLTAPALPDREVPFTECFTGLLSVRAADFAALGGFQDPTGGWPNWDDIDFGYRAHRAGYRIVFSGGARAIHHDAAAQNLASIAQRYYQASRMAVRLFRRYPEIEAHLPMYADMRPVDWRHEHPRRTGRKLLRRAASTWPVVRGLEAAAGALERRAPGSGLLPALKRWVVGGYIFQGYRRGLKERA